MRPTKKDRFSVTWASRLGFRGGVGPGPRQIHNSRRRWSCPPPASGSERDRWTREEEGHANTVSSRTADDRGRGRRDRHPGRLRRNTAADASPYFRHQSSRAGQARRGAQTDRGAGGRVNHRRRCTGRRGANHVGGYVRASGRQLLGRRPDVGSASRRCTGCHPSHAAGRCQGPNTHRRASDEEGRHGYLVLLDGEPSHARPVPQRLLPQPDLRRHVL